MNTAESLCHQSDSAINLEARGLHYLLQQEKRFEVTPDSLCQQYGEEMEVMIEAIDELIARHYLINIVGGQRCSVTPRLRYQGKAYYLVDEDIPM